MTATQVRFRNSSTGVAVKDGSYLLVDDVSATNVAFDLFMTYVKKPFYDGETRLIATDISTQNVSNMCKRATGTKLQIDAVFCPETNFDVGALYTGRMKK